VTPYRIRRRLRSLVAAAAVSCLLVTGCGDDPPSAPVDDDPRPIDLAAVSLGSEQTVVGTVTDVLSINSFELSGALEGGDPLLAVTPDAAPLDAGARVIVRGTVEELDADGRRAYGLDGADVPSAAVGSRFLLAESIDAPTGLEDR
jgi:hypothetical protein